jgi:hypothetical protein
MPEKKFYLACDIEKGVFMAHYAEQDPVPVEIAAYRFATVNVEQAAVMLYLAIERAQGEPPEGLLGGLMSKLLLLREDSENDSELRINAPGSDAKN